MLSEWCETSFPNGWKPVASVLAEDRLASLLVNPPKKNAGNPFEFLLGGKKEPELPKEEQDKLALRREDVLAQLRSGQLEDREIEIEVEDTLPQLEVGGNSINIGDMMGGMMPKRRKSVASRSRRRAGFFLRRNPTSSSTRTRCARRPSAGAEQQGIVFIDEIDKVAGRSSGGHGPDVSREGVQRDILPIVEGSTVNTKYGAVRTDFMLFIAAGAFHVAKVTDLIPELQGRFPRPCDAQEPDPGGLQGHPDTARKCAYPGSMRHCWQWTRCSFPLRTAPLRPLRTRLT